MKEANHIAAVGTGKAMVLVDGSAVDRSVPVVTLFSINFRAVVVDPVKLPL
jgi:hypothetical protein